MALGAGGMTCVMCIVTSAQGEPTSLDGEYIIDFQDMDDYAGLLTTTPEITDARRFDTPREALEFWRQQSKLRPLRPDLQPNRPLTAFTVEILPV